MPPLSGRAGRRVRSTAAFVAVAAVAYGAGLVTGVVGSSTPAAPDADGVLDEAAARIAARAAEPVDRQELNTAAVNGMLGALGDRWSTYYAAADFATFTDSLEGRYAGVGIWLRAADGAVVVSGVAPASPAASAGVRAGDLLRSVDGRPVADGSVAATSSLLRGEAGTVVELGLERGGGPRTVRVTRATVDTDDVDVDRLAAGVTVVRVTAFTRGVGAQVRDAVEAAGQGSAAGVVLDLRGDQGGLLTEAVEVASAFLDGGPVVSYERRGAGVTRLDAVGSGDPDVPLVVLVDAATASAAEVVAGALQDRRRAVVVGERTLGKGSVQEPSRLSDGSAIELTVGRYLTPDGRSIEGVGIEPDVLVDADDPAVAEARAVEVLAGLQASVSTSGRG